MRARMKRQRGFSLIEVMVAVAIMTVGATGLVMMQGATTRGNIVAQEQTIAVNIAQTWVERLKRESQNWSAAGGLITPNLSQGAGTPYLAQPTLAGESALFTSMGVDTSTASEVKYHVRLVNTVVHQEAGLPDAVRVDVTVYWFREVPNANDPTIATLAPSGYVPTALLDDALLNSDLTRKVYASVVLRPNGGAGV